VAELVGVLAAHKCSQAEQHAVLKLMANEQVTGSIDFQLTFQVIQHDGFSKRTFSKLPW